MKIMERLRGWWRRIKGFFTRKNKTEPFVQQANQQAPDEVPQRSNEASLSQPASPPRQAQTESPDPKQSGIVAGIAAMVKALREKIAVHSLNEGERVLRQTAAERKVEPHSGTEGFFHRKSSHGSQIIGTIPSPGGRASNAAGTPVVVKKTGEQVQESPGKNENQAAGPERLINQDPGSKGVGK